MDISLAFFVIKYDEFVILEGSDNVISHFHDKSAPYSVIKALFEEYETDNKFDVVLGNHVLEHVVTPLLL